MAHAQAVSNHEEIMAHHTALIQHSAEDSASAIELAKALVASPATSTRQWESPDIAAQVAAVQQLAAEFLELRTLSNQAYLNLDQVYQTFMRLGERVDSLQRQRQKLIEWSRDGLFLLPPSQDYMNPIFIAIQHKYQQLRALPPEILEAKQALDSYYPISLEIGEANKALRVELDELTKQLEALPEFQRTFPEYVQHSGVFIRLDTIQRKYLSSDEAVARAADPNASALNALTLKARQVHARLQAHKPNYYQSTAHLHRLYEHAKQLRRVTGSLAGQRDRLVEWQASGVLPEMESNFGLFDSIVNQSPKPSDTATN